MVVVFNVISDDNYNGANDHGDGVVAMLWWYDDCDDCGSGGDSCGHGQ
jgi:hypothetical protein